jgi:DNA uptake protein ComE-like DNA-binding protein
MSDPKTNSIPSLPIEEILASVAGSVVQAQQLMDEQSLASEVRLREQELDKNFGLSATWYTIPELALELRLAFEVSNKGEVKSQMVDAAYQSKYGFDLKASSLLQSKIVAVPPGESSGLSLLDKAVVLKKIGRLKKIAEAWGRSDAPHFTIRYYPFVRQGYNGGLWFVKLMDETLTGAVIRALVVIEDATEAIVRLLTDETEAPHGVVFPQKEALKAVIAVNKATETELREQLSIVGAPIALILENRPFDTVTAMGKVLGIGKVTMQNILAYVQTKP